MAKKQKTQQEILDEMNLSELVRALTQSVQMLKAYTEMGVLDKVLANPEIRAKFEAERTNLITNADELSKRFNAPVHYQN